VLDVLRDPRAHFLEVIKREGEHLSA
jgi:hypothetical protein